MDPQRLVSHEPNLSIGGGSYHDKSTDLYLVGAASLYKPPSCSTTLSSPINSQYNPIGKESSLRFREREREREGVQCSVPSLALFFSVFAGNLLSFHLYLWKGFSFCFSSACFPNPPSSLYPLKKISGLVQLYCFSTFRTLIFTNSGRKILLKDLRFCRNLNVFMKNGFREMIIDHCVVSNLITKKGLFVISFYWPEFWCPCGFGAFGTVGWCEALSLSMKYWFHGKRIFL